LGQVSYFEVFLILSV